MNTFEIKLEDMVGHERSEALHSETTYLSDNPEHDQLAMAWDNESKMWMPFDDYIDALSAVENTKSPFTAAVIRRVAKSGAVTTFITYQ
jgi:hypothetical protein